MRFRSVRRVHLPAGVAALAATAVLSPSGAFAQIPQAPGTIEDMERSRARGERTPQPAPTPQLP